MKNTLRSQKKYNLYPACIAVILSGRNASESYAKRFCCFFTCFPSEEANNGDTILFREATKSKESVVGEEAVPMFPPRFGTIVHTWSVFVYMCI